MPHVGIGPKVFHRQQAGLELRMFVEVAPPSAWLAIREGTTLCWRRQHQLHRLRSGSAATAIGSCADPALLNS